MPALSRPAPQRYLPGADPAGEDGDRPFLLARAHYGVWVIPRSGAPRPGVARSKAVLKECMGLSLFVWPVLRRLVAIDPISRDRTGSEGSGIAAPRSTSSYLCVDQIEIVEIRICVMQKRMNWQAVSLSIGTGRAPSSPRPRRDRCRRPPGRSARRSRRSAGRSRRWKTTLGVTLFERVGRSLSLTQSGLELLDHFRAMGDAASRVSLAASGQSQAIEGQVRITATDFMSTYHLPPVLKRIRGRSRRGSRSTWSPRTRSAI